MKMENCQKLLKIASRNSILKKGLLISMVVGTLLNLINQGNLLLTNQLLEVSLFKLSLTYLTPFVVSVYSTATAILKQESTTLNEIEL